MPFLPTFDPDRPEFRARPKPERDFIIALARYQGGDNAKDDDFAHRLGVSSGLWRHTKAGRRPLGWKILVAGSSIAGYDLTMAAQSSLIKRGAERSGGTRQREGDAA